MLYQFVGYEGGPVYINTGHITAIEKVRNTADGNGTLVMNVATTSGHVYKVFMEPSDLEAIKEWIKQ